VPLQVYSADGQLIASFGDKRCIPLAYAKIPQDLIHAIIATEDQRYFQHPGVDIPGLVRASIQLLVTGHKEQGGSTITMQLARSFYLNPHKTFSRKLREILLALKIDNTLAKEKILELYLNKIFFGNRAYGVAAAAELYYGKPLAELSIAQYAMLAGIPKAPSILNPLANKVAALKRRNHVLTRMLELHYINEKTYYHALQQPLTARYHQPQVQVNAPYVAELVRNQVEKQYGPNIYNEGIKIYTTISSKLQNFANNAVLYGVIHYEQRHGYRGAEKNLGVPQAELLPKWRGILSKIPVINQLEPAAVLSINPLDITVLRANGEQVRLYWQQLKWARRRVIDSANHELFSPSPKIANEIVKPGDIVRIIANKNGWDLVQVPQVEASLVALNPMTGAIVALVGGFDYNLSKFNRVTNALRQPGSSFKPFIYAAALDHGFNLASIINDAPLVMANTSNSDLWRPQNSNHKFYGATRLRTALMQSRNVVAIKLLEQLGLDYTMNYVEKFGFTRQQLPSGLSLALGTAMLTSLQLANGYAVFANGGYKVTPYIIKSIINSAGKVIFQAKPVVADSANISQGQLSTQQQHSQFAPQVISPETAFLISSALHDVIQYGTATQARSLQRNDLAGKTGTTPNDAWFAGYNRQLLAISWLGFDRPQALYEYGNQAALPIWLTFMQHALAQQPDSVLLPPEHIVSIFIDAITGKRTVASNPYGFFEYFMPTSLPDGSRTTAVANDALIDLY
jgi:penicillin-binding protein 1A